MRTVCGQRAGWMTVARVLRGELADDIAPRRARACYNQGIVRHPRVCRRPDSAPLAREHQRQAAPASKRVFMVGILIVTHGNLGVTLAECAQHILQRELPHLAVMAVDKNDDPDRKLAEARELVRGWMTAAACCCCRIFWRHSFQYRQPADRAWPHRSRGRRQPAHAGAQPVLRRATAGNRGQQGGDWWPGRG